MFTKIRTIALSLLAGAAVAAPASSAHAGPSWQRLVQPSPSYCADGTDFGPGFHSQHISSAGQLYMLGCDEAFGENAHVYGWSSSTGTFADAGGGFLQFISAVPSGNAWGVGASNDGTFGPGGPVFFWNNATRSWQPRHLPGGTRPARGVAGVNDTTAFLLAERGSDSCSGGTYCVWLTTDAGSTYGMWGTDWDGPVGADAIAYDPVTGLPWLLQGGHVFRVGTYYGMTYLSDVGVSGLPNPQAAARLAVWNGVPWVIADVLSESGGPVYALWGSTWVPIGNEVATDIALDASTGKAWIVVSNDVLSSNNIKYWQNVR